MLASSSGGPALGADFCEQVGALVADVAIALAARRRSGTPDLVGGDTDNLVTTLDLWAQSTLTASLRGLLPSAGIVAEEGLRADLVTAAPGAWTWVIDPIDGTASYVAGLPTYAVQVALCRNSTTVGAWVHAPALDWRARACADSELIVENINKNTTDMTAGYPAKIVIADGDFDEAHRSLLASRRIPGVRRTSSCAIDYVALTAGMVDALVYRRTHPWDHAPGAYLASRSGACVTRWDGTPYSPSVAGEGLLVLGAGVPGELGHRLLPP